MKRQDILKRKTQPFTLKELKELLNQTEIVDNGNVEICIERDGGGECFMLVGVEVSIGMGGKPTIYISGMNFNPTEDDLDCNELQNNYNEYAQITAKNADNYWEDNDIFDADGKWSPDGTCTLPE